jgi:two-component system response regulator FixJ
MVSEPMVYIVDAEPGDRRPLKMVVETAGLRAKQFDSAETFLEAIDETVCGCVLADFRLNGMSGLQLLSALKSRNSALMTIIITGHADVAAAVECMKEGAVDFLEKPLDHHLLLIKIEEAMARSESVQLNRAKVALGQSRLTALTSREKDILRMLVSGKSSKQIAVETSLSLKTVSNHRAHLLAKTGAENTADLVRIALVAELVKRP